LSAKIYIALPVLNELDYISACLNSISKQTYRNFELWVCVNQAEEWHNDYSKKEIINNNQQVINLLNQVNNFPIHIIDKSSKGKGWDNKKACVGWARKVVMDAISSKADKNDIILSLDADTTFDENYFQSIINIFEEKPKAVALANPYYHKLTDDEILNRAVLRYEIYMRYYAVNMFRIESPYSYTALGSAIAVPNWAYTAIGGITPKKSGEDFYFLQKLTKYGVVVKYNTETVFPATRYSDRVFFGTGPALIKGSTGDWESYPIYHYSLFDDIKKTQDLYPTLFTNNIDTPLSFFLMELFKEENIWLPLRNNFKDIKQFIKACHHKIDGLRILQYLKTMQKQILQSDETNLKDYLHKFMPNDKLKELNINFETFSFAHSPIEELNIFRDFLMQQELVYQKEEYDHI